SQRGVYPRRVDVGRQDELVLRGPPGTPPPGLDLLRDARTHRAGPGRAAIVRPVDPALAPSVCLAGLDRAVQDARIALHPGTPGEGDELAGRESIELAPGRAAIVGAEQAPLGGREAGPLAGRAGPIEVESDEDILITPGLRPGLAAVGRARDRASATDQHQLRVAGVDPDGRHLSGAARHDAPGRSAVPRHLQWPAPAAHGEGDLGVAGMPDRPDA